MYCVVTMECSSEVIVFACAYIKGQMRFKMAGKFKSKETSCTTSQRRADIMHSQSDYIPGVADEYNP